MSQPYLQVTAQQQIQDKITNTSKISKQLLKSQLTVKKKELFQSYKDVNKEAREAYINMTETIKELAVKAGHAWVSNDADVTRFRNLFAKFSRFSDLDCQDFPKFTSNLSMVQEITVPDLYKLGCVSEDQSKLTNKVIAEKVIDIEVNFAIPDRMHADDAAQYPDDEYDNPLGFALPMNLAAEHVSLITTYIDLNQRARQLNVAYNDVDRQLMNIDSVTEEMEAQLLVQELSKTDEGKEALAVAGNLVSNMLGDTPPMLEAYTQKEDEK